MASVLELDGNTFDEVISGDGVVVVDFWAPWCGPCTSFAPVFESAAQQNPRATFAKLDTSVHQQVSAAVGVRSIPTVMVFRDGVLVAETVGVSSEQALTDAVSDAEALDIDAFVANLRAGTGFADGAVV